MTKPDHLNNDLLIRAIDDELPESEMIRVELHLADCEQCRRAYNELRSLTLDLESFLATIPAQQSPAVRAPEAQSNAFEVAGELFSPLPYSNPDLPIGAPHIVRMQVPVSSLSDAGIVFEPVSNQTLTADSSVLADVLLGMDGQPLGVHVLGVE